MVNILILEDHPMMVESIKASVRGTSFKAQVYVANSLGDLTSSARLMSMVTPSLVVADLNVPDSRGWDTLVYLRNRYVGVPIFVFSQTDEPNAERDALAFGATAYVNKSSHPQVFLKKLQEMLEHIHEQLPAWMTSSFAQEDGETEGGATEDVFMRKLTAQHKKILAALASGLDTEKVAEHLALTQQTVRAHLTKIYQRLEVKNRSQAIVLYLKWKNHHDN